MNKALDEFVGIDKHKDVGFNFKKTKLTPLEQNVDELMKLLFFLLQAFAGNCMWNFRSMSLISAVTKSLVYMRDQKEIILDIQTFREYLILENIVKLYKTRIDFPEHIRESLRAYLFSIPTFQEDAVKQSDIVMEQHGYTHMQFNKMLDYLFYCYS